jgi:hypothetical protein
MKFSFRPKILDIVIFVAGIAAIVLISLGVYSGSSDTLYVQITGESGEWLEPLDSNRDLDVPGPLGLTHVHIANGSVAITDSPCENKLCVAMGAILGRNQWVACLPNNVFVRIGGKTDNKDALDAASF